jgi:uncharacterized protein (TIGR02001 family)
LAALLVFALHLPAAPARAQAGDALNLSVSGSASLLSDYRFRGQALSDGQPVPQLALNVDSAGGWYAGGYASGATYGELRGAQLLGYAGYAARLAGGGSWEAGCSSTVFTQWRQADYQECYAGLAGERFSGRLYFAPQYLGRPTRTVYAEANFFYPLHPRLNLSAHAGLLRNLSGGSWAGIPAGSRYDLRLAASIPLGDWSLQLARVQSKADSISYLHYPRRSPRAWVLGASYAF